MRGSSRFMRNIKQALVFRDEIHARGAVVYICDERILSSDERGEALDDTVA